MFVYRAIMEMAQFGDTEVNSSELKSTWQELLSNAGKTLELEFARLANMVDDRKSLAGELVLSNLLFHELYFHLKKYKADQ